jgi:hypothetical protein
MEFLHNNKVGDVIKLIWKHQINVMKWCCGKRVGNVITSKTIWRRLWFKESKRSERKWEDFLRRENELTTIMTKWTHVAECGCIFIFYISLCYQPQASAEEQSAGEIPLLLSFFYLFGETEPDLNVHFLALRSLFNLLSKYNEWN